jgi:phospholipase/lecithinase/hemolysin
VALIGANTDFYDAAETNNGLNQDWFRYQNTDWGVYFRTEVDITYGGVPMSYTQDSQIEINDYESNTDFTTKDVETYDMSGNSLFDSINSRWYVQSFANTQVKATFVKNVPIDINLCYVVFGIQIFEQGGIGTRQRYSSKWQTSNPLTCFIPLTGVSGNRIELSQPTTDTIIAKAVIDYTLLPQGNITYTIVARLYENDGTSGNKITEDDIDKFTEDDEQKIIE